MEIINNKKVTPSCARRQRLFRQAQLGVTGMVCFIILISGCASVKPGAVKRSFRQLITDSPLFTNHFTGFALYDPDTKSMVYEHLADRYYTPASNTKLFTFYAGLKLLGDSIPALTYSMVKDTLFVRGTGDPSFLHPDLPPSPAYAFLKNWKGPIFLDLSNLEDPAFGPGWSWGDYGYYYSCEKSAFPIHGNFARARIPADKTEVEVSPSLFSYFMVPENEAFSPPGRIWREQYSNRFWIKGGTDTLDYNRDIPYHYSPEIALKLLKDTLKQTIHLLPSSKKISFPQMLMGLPADTIYQAMLQPSDNFLAEQILLMCGAVKFDTLNSRRVIDFVLDSLLSDLPDRPRWVDGSGLSRYNLFTPRSMIHLLDKLYSELDREHLFAMLPAGGVRGTIRSWYKGEEGPYIFAKTGTLSNNHNLSGYLVTKSGKTLIFSFMNNHYMHSSSEIKTEMAKLLVAIHNRW